MHLLGNNATAAHAAIKDATSSLSHSESKSLTLGAAPAGLVGSAVLAIADNIALSQNTTTKAPWAKAA